MDHLPCNIGHGIEVPLEPSGDSFDPQNPNHRFHSYPTAVGWIYNEENDTIVSIDQFTGNRLRFKALLQSWLFFGLLATVIRTNDWVPFASIESFNEYKEGNRGYVHTRGLEKLLEAWKVQEHNNPDGLFNRMMRAEVVLVKARRIILKYCSYEDGRTPPGGEEYMIEPRVALSLMVMGETLSAAKYKIVKQADLPQIRGWYGDASEGWGTPGYIINEMTVEDRWCKNTVHTLRGQLMNHATSFVAAWAAHSKAKSHFEDHGKCEDKTCKYKSEDADENYETKHNKMYCKGAKNCFMIGPKMPRLLECLNGDDGTLPLLTFVTTREGQDLSVTDVNVDNYSPQTKFATFSHIWSDGYGNENANQLYPCQLRFFYQLLEHEKLDRNIPFYIDTLLVPVGNENKTQRLRAIRKINKVFQNSSYTVVIDNGLRKMTPGQGYELMAMKMLASGWMRRLWTLEEAYLSNKLFVVFDDTKTLLDVDDDLEPEFQRAQNSLNSNMAEIAQVYFRNILGTQRKQRTFQRAQREQGGNKINDATEGVVLVASVWQAARWRTTTHVKHQTLALATLLNLEKYSDLIAEAGLRPDESPDSIQKIKTEADLQVQEERLRIKLEAMMAELWSELSNHLSSGIIPPGIIFTPGKRLSIPDFGWAPKDWMVGHKDKGGYPDPTRSTGKPMQPAKLKRTFGDQPGGLIVKFRGFILHAKSREAILGPHSESFTFPSDNTLLDWYTVDTTIDPIEDKPASIREYKKLAIILSGSRPRDIPEIALLVEFNDYNSRRDNVWHVTIIRRVLIRREKRQLLTQRNYIVDSEGNEDHLICGELVDETQEWCVDGRRTIPPTPAAEPPASKSYVAQVAGWIPGVPWLLKSGASPSKNLPSVLPSKSSTSKSTGSAGEKTVLLRASTFHERPKKLMKTLTTIGERFE